jgi:hypothetical protein
LLVIYGPPYEDKKVKFIDELHPILSNCNGSIIVGGGGFNLSRFASDKNNGRIVKKYADCFND